MHVICICISHICKCGKLNNQSLLQIPPRRNCKVGSMDTDLLLSSPFCSYRTGSNDTTNFILIFKQHGNITNSWYGVFECFWTIHISSISEYAYADADAHPHPHPSIHLSIRLYIHIHITYMYDASGTVNFREPTSQPKWSTGAATSCGSSRWMASGCAALRRKAWGTEELGLEEVQVLQVKIYSFPTTRKSWNSRHWDDFRNPKISPGSTLRSARWRATCLVSKMQRECDAWLVSVVCCVRAGSNSTFFFFFFVGFVTKWLYGSKGTNKYLGCPIIGLSGKTISVLHRNLLGCPIISWHIPIIWDAQFNFHRGSPLDGKMQRELGPLGPASSPRFFLEFHGKFQGLNTFKHLEPTSMEPLVSHFIPSGRGSWTFRWAMMSAWPG